MAALLRPSCSLSPTRGTAWPKHPELAEQGMEKAVPGVYKPVREAPAQTAESQNLNAVFVVAALLLAGLARCGLWIHTRKTK